MGVAPRESYDILMPLKDQVHIIELLNCYPIDSSSCNPSFDMITTKVFFSSPCFRMQEMRVVIREVKNLSRGATLKINPSDGNTVRFLHVVCYHNRCQ